MIGRVGSGLLVVTATFLCQLGVASATFMARMELDDMARAAEIITVARVESQTARWDQTGRRIVTDVVVRVETAVKGPAPQGGQLTFERLGGVVDGIGQRVFGEATFRSGETVLLFLRRLPLAPGRPLRVVGMAQGKFVITTDASGVRRVNADLSGLSLVSRDQLGQQTAQAPAVTPDTLDGMLRAVQRALAPGAASHGGVSR